MANITRIKNNQITDSTITYTKLSPGTLVGSVFNSDLTLNSNVTILGNFSITGNSSTINSTNTYVNDPLMVFNNGYVGTPSYDIGIIANRNLGSLAPYGSVNTAFVWKESEEAWVAIATTETGTTTGSINNTGWSNVKVGNLTAVSSVVTANQSIGGALAVTGSSSFTGAATFTTAATGGLQAVAIGNVTPGTAAFTTLTTSGTIIASGNIVAGSGTASGDTTHGALVVNGGTGITGALNVGGVATFSSGVTSEGVGTGAVLITNGGGLSVTGNVNVGGNINVTTGNIITTNSAFFVGNTTTGFNAVYAGIPSGYSILPQVVAQFSENYDGYAQLNTQNINAGGNATTDYVATANNGDDTTFYVDLGIAGSGYDPESPFNSMGTALSANDAYLYTQANTSAQNGGNLVIGTTTDQRSIRFVVGGGDAEHIAVAINHANTASTNSTTGALVVTGGVGVSGTISAASAQFGSINNTPIGNATPSTGAFTTLSASGTLNVTGAATFTTATTGGFQALAIGNVTPGTGNFTTGTIANFASGNAIITGGTLSGLTSVNATTGTIANFASSNVVVTGGSLSGLTSINATTGTIANFASSNVVVTGGTLSGLSGGTGSATSGTTQTLRVAGGGIAVIGDSYLANSLGIAQNLTVTGTTGLTGDLTFTTATGGGLQVLAIGNVTPGTGAFTTLSASSTLGVTGATTLTTATAGGLQAKAIGNVTPGSGAFTTLTASSIAQLTNSTESTNATSGALQVTGGVGIAKNLNVGGNVVITGNLTVNGDVTTINASTLDVEDLNITVAKGAANPAAANGAGITVDGAGATLTYSSTTDSWDSNKQFIGTGATFSNATASTNTTTGALVVTGGVGIGGAVYAGSVFDNGVRVVSTSGGAGNLSIVSGNITLPLTGPGAATAGGTLSIPTIVTDAYGRVVSLTSNVLSVPATSITGTVATANVSLYEAVTAFTTNQTFYPTFANISTTGNTQQGVSSALTYNPSTGTLGATVFTGAVSASTITASSTLAVTGETTLTTSNVGGLQAVAIGNVTPGTAAFTTVTTSGTVIASGNIVAAATTSSTDNNTGSFIAKGGVGIAGNINAGVTGSSVHAIKGNVLLGQGTTASGVLTINLNTAGPIAAGNNVVHVSGLTGNDAHYGIDTYGTGVKPGFFGRHARGTAATPAAVQTNDVLGEIHFRGYGSTGYTPATNNAPGITVKASENFTDSAQGAALVISTTRIGEVSATPSTIYAPNGNVVILGSTASTSTNTGALVVKGGAGFNGNVHTSGDVNVSGIVTTTDVVITGRFETSSNVDTTAPGLGTIFTPGGASIGGNAYVGKNLYIGPASFDTPLTTPTIIAVDNGSAYAQIAIRNTAASGSSDFAAYPDNGTDSAGWVDMGIAGSAFSDSNYTITKPNDGYLFTRPLDGTFGGNLVLGTSEVGTHNDIVIASGSFLESAEVARIHGNVSTNGTFIVKLPTATTAANTGAFQVWGGTSISGNLWANSAVTINGSQTANYDFKVYGKNTTNLIWARPSATYDQVVIGNTLPTANLVGGSKLQINSTDSILLPVGSAAQRPGSVGFSDVTGMFRYSTTLNSIEWYNGVAWDSVTSNFTVITDDQYSGDGNTVDFELADITTTAGVIVSINGVLQIPTLAYSVLENGTTLRFTEAPTVGDIIDVRILTTTQTVTGIHSQSGLNQLVTDNSGVYVYTAPSGTSIAVNKWDQSGAQVSLLPNVSVASANTATTIDSFDKTVYRTAKYVVQATHGTDYQSLEALVVHNGTTATVVSYGVVSTNGNLGVLDTTITGGNVVVQFTSANTSTVVRIKKDYLVV